MQKSADVTDCVVAAGDDVIVCVVSVGDDVITCIVLVDAVCVVSTSKWEVKTEAVVTCTLVK